MGRGYAAFWNVPAEHTDAHRLYTDCITVSIGFLAECRFEHCLGSRAFLNRGSRHDEIVDRYFDIITYFLYRPTFQIIEATFVTNPNPVLAYPPQNIHANLLDLYPYM